MVALAIGLGSLCALVGPVDRRVESGSALVGPQGVGSPVVARFVLDGKSSVVSRDDLALELARRFRRAERGRLARKFMIDIELIRTAAENEGLMPNMAETRRWIAELETKLRAAGMDLKALMAGKGMTRGEFEKYAMAQLAHERLVRRALGLGAGSAVTKDMLQLWLDDARRKFGVVTDEAKLRPGVVAMLGKRSLTELDLGHALMGGTDPETKQKHTHNLVFKQCIRALARKHGIVVTPEDMKKEVEARRKEAEVNPIYRGASFEELLKSQGTTVEELHRSPVLRAQIQERRLAEVLMPDEKLTRRLAEERDEVRRRHGARRRIQVVVERDASGGRDGMLASLRQVRDRINTGMPFDEAARNYSDDPYTKVTDGDAGWHHRSSAKLPKQVVDAAFAANKGAVSEPIETPRGFYLVRVASIEPEPNDATLKFRMRAQFAAELRQRVVAEAKIEFVGAAVRSGAGR